MAYTPRPWKAHLEGMDAYVTCSDGRRFEIGDIVYHEENKDNARLIAESPQLFEALKRLRAASLCDICYEDKCDHWLCDCKCHAEIGEANEQADIAIAAVEGDNHVQI